MEGNKVSIGEFLNIAGVKLNTVKKNAEKTFDAIGLNMSTAINIFLKAVVRENRIPFELSADPFYSETNIERLRESIRKVETGEKTLTEHELIEG